MARTYTLTITFVDESEPPVTKTASLNALLQHFLWNGQWSNTEKAVITMQDGNGEPVEIWNNNDDGY